MPKTNTYSLDYFSNRFDPIKNGIKIYISIMTTFCYEGISLKRLGAGEACWAHNPKVLGSKPRAATTLIFFLFRIDGKGE